MNLDQLDIKILELLQKSEMLTPKLSKIAKTVGSTNATVYRRVEALKKEGIIVGHTTRVDAGMIGRPLHSFIFLKMNKGVDKAEKEEISKRISAVGGVEAVYVPMSKWSYILMTRHTGLSELDKFIQEDLAKLPLEEMQIELISKTVKEDSAIMPIKKSGNQ